MTHEDTHWRARAEVYGAACKEIARNRREWRKAGGVIPPQCDESDRRMFRHYLRIARQANAKLREISERETA